MVVNLTHQQWLNMMRTHLLYIDGLSCSPLGRLPLVHCGCYVCIYIFWCMPAYTQETKIYCEINILKIFFISLSPLLWLFQPTTKKSIRMCIVLYILTSSHSYHLNFLNFVEFSSGTEQPIYTIFIHTNECLSRRCNLIFISSESSELNANGLRSHRMNMKREKKK